MTLEYMVNVICTGLLEQWGPEGPLPPSLILTAQLILAQPGVGQIMPTTVLRAHPDFETFLRH